MPENASAPDPVVSPLLIGYRPPHDRYLGLTDAFNRACGALPATRSVRIVKSGVLKNARIATSREAVSVPGVDGQSARRARLVDRGETESVADAVNRWVWEVSYAVFERGVLAPTIEEDAVPVVLDVTRFKIREGGVVAAAQLALFRHLFVSGLRCLDPGLVVVGGQHAWDESMWRAITA